MLWLRVRINTNRRCRCVCVWVAASTCMNLLKLPPYESEDVMLDKIVNAIAAAVGFDLS